MLAPLRGIPSYGSEDLATGAAPGVRVRLFRLANEEYNGACGKVVELLEPEEDDEEDMSRYVVEILEAKTAAKTPSTAGPRVVVGEVNVWAYDPLQLDTALRCIRRSAPHMSRKALVALLDRIPAEDIEMLASSSMLSPPEGIKLAARTAWVLDQRLELGHLEAHAENLARGGAIGPADSGVQARESSGPLSISDDITSFLKYGVEYGEDHETFFSTAALVDAIALETQVVQQLEAIHHSAVAVQEEQVPRLVVQCGLEEDALRRAWQILSAEYPVSSIHVPMLLGAVTESWKGRAPGASMRTVSEVCRVLVRPWQVRALERTMGVADHNDEIRAAVKHCAKHQEIAREMCPRQCSQLLQEVLDGGALISDHMVASMNTKLGRIKTEPFRDGINHDAIGQFLCLMENVVEKLPRNTYARTRVTLNKAWLLYERACGGYTLSEYKDGNLIDEDVDSPNSKRLIDDIRELAMMRVR